MKTTLEGETQQQQKCNSVTTIKQQCISHEKQTDLIKYLHVDSFSPVKSTSIDAIQKGYFQSCPGFNVQHVNTYLPSVKVTTRVHIDQVRENKRSTRLQ